MRLSHGQATRGGHSCAINQVSIQFTGLETKEGHRPFCLVVELPSHIVDEIPADFKTEVEIKEFKMVG